MIELRTSVEKVLRWTVASVIVVSWLTACDGRAIVGGQRDGGMDAIPTCTGEQQLCGSLCVDVRNSDDHCGECGHACSPGQRCMAGVCRVVCPAGQVACPSESSPSDGGTREICVLTDTDRNHCGMCGRACPAGQVCSMGRCTTTCAEGLALCGEGTDRTCADTRRDPAHCGACGNACPPGQICSMGRCVTSCPVGQTPCATGDAGTNVCVDLQTDRNHCGACGNACPPGQICSMGRCITSCPVGQTPCATGDAGTNVCVDLQTDRNHCGACGNACPPGQICSMGRCVTSCPVGQEACGGFCVFTNSDPNHCGGCGITCPDRANADRVCVAGTCSYVCSSNFGDCDSDPVNGCETALATSVNHCGRCGNTCPARTNATPTCTTGTCGFICSTGFGDCDGNPINGCEIDTRTTVSHCGRCGNACPARANATPTCTAGTCGFVCNPGFADCDGNPDNGCEVDLNTSSSHCGRCGNACPAGASCNAGTCGSLCFTGTPRVLVYGPGGTGGSRFFPAGTNVVVASDAMWRSMTTSDFGTYDVIWIDGASCSGSLSSVYGTAEATVSVWGPAVRGRIVLLSGDPDLHGDGGAPRFYQNTLNWLKTMGRNATGGRTSLFFNWGCTQVTTPYTPGAMGSPERFASVLGTGLTGNATNFCAAYTTTAGLTHPVLAGVTTYWSCPMHGGFSTIPSGYVVLATGTPGGTATLIARESPVPCIP